MTLDRTLLTRYLRQLGENGTRELFLESMTAEEALSAIGGTGISAFPTPGDGTDILLTAESAESAKTGLPRSSGAPATAVAADSGEKFGKKPLTVLRTEASSCTKCRLHEGRKNVVFGEGSATADVVVVGEAPGAQEDRTGRPFVGPAGKLLDLLLLSVGLPRDRVFICNVLKCRPPGNRDPRADEVESCSPYLHRQLEITAPRVLLAVGKFAAQMLSGSGASIGSLRGRVHEYRGVPVVASYHPAYLLRGPSRTRATWEDFQLLRKVIDEQS